MPVMRLNTTGPRASSRSSAWTASTGAGCAAGAESRTAWPQATSWPAAAQAVSAARTALTVRTACRWTVCRRARTAVPEAHMGFRLGCQRRDSHRPAVERAVVGLRCVTEAERRRVREVLPVAEGKAGPVIADCDAEWLNDLLEVQQSGPGLRSASTRPSVTKLPLVQRDMAARFLPVPASLPREQCPPLVQRWQAAALGPLLGQDCGWMPGNPGYFPGGLPPMRTETGVTLASLLQGPADR